MTDTFKERAIAALKALPGTYLGGETLGDKLINLDAAIAIIRALPEDDE